MVKNEGLKVEKGVIPKLVQNFKDKKLLDLCFRLFLLGVAQKPKNFIRLNKIKNKVQIRKKKNNFI
ncbi:MAG: hypothetical protein CM15mP65_29160 [Crocinitomicaceae bacterium]|nr:MAG: hypothetical protein CM15mP65_29160 [Crocinitomicaceae bacterium]